MANLEAELKRFLESGGEWEKMATPVDAVSVVKVPATKTRPALLFLEINPIVNGKPLKRKGLFVGSKEILVKFGEALNDDKTFQLISELEKVNPEIPKNGTTKKLDF